MALGELPGVHRLEGSLPSPTLGFSLRIPRWFPSLGQRIHQEVWLRSPLTGTSGDTEDALGVYTGSEMAVTPGGLSFASRTTSAEPFHAQEPVSCLELRRREGSNDCGDRPCAGHQPRPRLGPPFSAHSHCGLIDELL